MFWHAGGRVGCAVSTLDLSCIVQGAYSAALREDLWEPWSLDLMKALGGSGGLFWIVDSQAGHVSRVVATWGPARAFDEYVAGQYLYDPQLPLAASLPGAQVYVGLPGVDVEAEPARDFLKWQRSVVRNVHHQTAVTRLGGGRLQAGISVHRNAMLGPVERPDHDVLCAIWPELSRAIALGYDHGEMLRDSFWDGAIIGCGDQLALLVDDTQRVVRLTEAAERLVARGDGLTVREGALIPSLLTERAMLDRIVAGSARREAPRSGAMRISRPSGRAPLVLVAYPLPRSTRIMAPVEASALVTLIDPGLHPPRPQSLLRQAFDLTEREADMAVRLLDGHSIESAAAILGIAAPTARTHMRRLYEKTGTTGQVGLVQLLSRLG